MLLSTSSGSMSLMSPSKSLRLRLSRFDYLLTLMVLQKAGSFSTHAKTRNRPVISRPMSSPIAPEKRDTTLYFLEGTRDSQFGTRSLYGERRRMQV